MNVRSRQQPEPPEHDVRAVPVVTAPARQADIAAPHWLTQLLKPKRVPIDWPRSVRAGLTLPMPLALGLAFGQPVIGALVTIGTLFAVMNSPSGPYRDRVRRLGVVMSASALGFFLGELVGGFAGEQSWWSAGLVVLISVISALISATSNVASAAGLQLLVGSILGIHESTIVGPFTGVLWLVVGAGWVVLSTVAAWPLRATGPERQLVAAVYDDVAAMLAASGTAEGEQARRRLTTTMNAAYDTVLTARSRLAGRDRVYRRLFLVLTETTPLVEASVALLNANHRPPRVVLDAVRAVGAAIAADKPPPPIELPDGGSPALVALKDALRHVVGLPTSSRGADAAKARTHRPAWRERFDAWFDEVIAGPATWSHAGRLALCMALAEGLAVLLHLQRSYWVPLTIALVFKPDFGSVFGRAVLRGGGTAVGVLIGAVLLVLSPNVWILVAVATLIGFLLPIAQDRHYGMLSTVVSPMVLILLDLGRRVGWSLAVDRLVDTLVACVTVLIFGYLLWPGSRAPRLGGLLADTVDAIADYADRALRADPCGRSALRRRTYQRLADLRTEFQRVLVEPSAAGRLAAAWYPAILGLERVTSGVTRLSVEIQQGEPPLSGEEADAIVAHLREIHSAVCAERAPTDPPALTAPRLSRLGSDLALVVSGLRGPDLETPRPFALVRWLRPERRERGSAP